jgi:hypothetical protein
VDYPKLLKPQRQTMSKEFPSVVRPYLSHLGSKLPFDHANEVLQPLRGLGLLPQEVHPPVTGVVINDDHDVQMMPFA